MNSIVLSPWVGKTAPWLQLRGVQARSWATSGSTARIEIVKAQIGLGLPGSLGRQCWWQDQGQMGLLLSFWVYFWICTQDHSLWACTGCGPASGMCLTTQNGPPQPWTPPGYCNLLFGSQRCHKGTFVHGCLLNYSCDGEIWVGDFLFCYLEDITITLVSQNFFTTVVNASLGMKVSLKTICSPNARLSEITEIENNKIYRST